MDTRVIGNNMEDLYEISFNEIIDSDTKCEIAVNVKRLYIQKTKFLHNSKRKKEIAIISDALNRASSPDHSDYKYVAMNSEDVKICFKNNGDSMPRGSFRRLGTVHEMQEYEIEQMVNA